MGVRVDLDWRQRPNFSSHVPVEVIGMGRSPDLRMQVDVNYGDVSVVLEFSDGDHHIRLMLSEDQTRTLAELSARLLSPALGTPGIGER